MNCCQCHDSGIKRNAQPCVHKYVVGDLVWYYTSSSPTLFDIPQQPSLVEITSIEPTYTTIKIYYVRYTTYDFTKCITGDWSFYAAKHEAFEVYVRDLTNRQSALEVQLKIVKEALAQHGKKTSS